MVWAGCLWWFLPGPWWQDSPGGCGGLAEAAQLLLDDLLLPGHVLQSVPVVRLQTTRTTTGRLILQIITIEIVLGITTAMWPPLRCIHKTIHTESYSHRKGISNLLNALGGTRP